MGEYVTRCAANINAGEMWRVLSGAQEKYVVTLGIFDDYAATIMLQEREPKENAVPMRVIGGIMYADAGRLGYVYHDKLMDYVRAITDEERAMLYIAIADALGVAEPLSAELVDKSVELEAALEEIGSLRAELQMAITAQHEGEKCIGAGELLAAPAWGLESELKEELAVARKEAEIYKGLYEDMVKRVLA